MKSFFCAVKKLSRANQNREPPCEQLLTLELSQTDLDHLSHPVKYPNNPHGLNSPRICPIVEEFLDLPSTAR